MTETVQAIPFWSRGSRKLKFFRNIVNLVSAAYIVLLLLVALFAPVIAPYHYDFEDTTRYSVTPSPPDKNHWLGTDEVGEDVLSRLMYGARVSLGVALVAVTIEICIGLPFGLAAGFYGRFTDTVLMRFTDGMFAFPDILLAILLRAAIAPPSGQPLPPTLNIATLFLALGVVQWPSLARLVRGQAMSLRDREFVDAARVSGMRNGAIIRRHILPNLAGPVVVQITQDLAGVILAEATLSFLGLGVLPPYPSWGYMIYDALPQMQAHPILLLAPGILLALTVMAFNFLGDGLSDYMDPKRNQRGQN